MQQVQCSFGGVVSADSASWPPEKKWAPPCEVDDPKTQAERIVSQAPVLRGHVWLFSGSVVL